MVVRYPHTLTVESLQESQQDGDGNWVTTAGEEVEPVKCRFEQNTKGALIKAVDGSDLLYSGVIWLKEKADLPIGAKVTVLDGATVKATGDVKQKDASQQTNRLWL
jgi:hypothetical protein